MAIQYVLDTDIVSLLRREPDTGRVRARVAATDLTTLAISVITVEEQLAGWFDQIRRAPTPALRASAYAALAQTVPFLAHFSILPFTESAMTRFDVLKAMRLNVKGNDLRIAATALEINATVVTHNKRDFERILGVSVEDWAQF